MTSPCGRCHEPSRWKPSTFDHGSLFELDRDHQAPCATCHPDGNLGRYTCCGCHQHDPDRVRAEHAEERIQEPLDDCARCHRSAREGGEGGHGDGHED
jgi:hypothetical protein